MKKTSENEIFGFTNFQNVESKVKINMTLDKNHIRKLNEDGFEDVREIALEKDVEFGINDLGGETHISFGFGTIKIEKAKFREALKRYQERNEYIEKF